MSLVCCARDLEDAIASENCVDEAALVRAKIQQAQELVLQMNQELLSIDETIDLKKQEKYKVQNHLWSLRWWERYQFRKHGRTPKNNYWADSFKVIRNYQHHVQPPKTVEEQDELIQNLREKLLHKSNSFAEEKKIIQHIKQAEEIRKTLPQISRFEDKQTGNMEAYRANLKRMKHEQKVADDLMSAEKELQSFREIRVRMNKKRSEVHRQIYVLLTKLDQVPLISSPATNL